MNNYMNFEFILNSYYLNLLNLFKIKLEWILLKMEKWKKYDNEIKIK